MNLMPEITKKKLRAKFETKMESKQLKNAICLVVLSYLRWSVNRSVKRLLASCL